MCLVVMHYKPSACPFQGTNYPVVPWSLDSAPWYPWDVEGQTKTDYLELLGLAGMRQATRERFISPDGEPTDIRGEEGFQLHLHLMRPSAGL